MGWAGRAERRMRTVGMVAAIVATGVAVAQGPVPSPRTPPAAVALEKASEVPDSQKLERSTQALSVMRDVLRQVIGKVEEARRTKDVVKLNCANEKLFVEVEEPENLPGGDPTRPPPPDDIFVRPPPASPIN